MCSLQRIKVEKEDGTSTSLILKQIADERRCQVSKSLGLIREALFYLSPLSREFEGHLAHCYYAYADASTGAKYILMEDLQGSTHAGFLFGRGNPNNWSKTEEFLSSLSSSFFPPSSSLKDYIEATFLSMSRVHAKYWCSEELMKYEWLRGSDWWTGEGEERWKGMQMTLGKNWDKMKLRMEKSDEIRALWPADLVDLVESSLLKISWDSYLDFTKSRKWTLVSGDCHPANFLWYPNKEVKILDFEMVGIGSGPQDLAQFFISHSTPESRRSCEMDILKTYYADLISRGVQNYDWEECLRDYIEGGVERWMWMLIYFCGRDDLPVAVQSFFNQQTIQFCRDHGVTPQTIGQPRP